MKTPKEIEEELKEGCNTFYFKKDKKGKIREYHCDRYFQCPECKAFDEGFQKSQEMIKEEIEDLIFFYKDDKDFDKWNKLKKELLQKIGVEE